MQLDARHERSIGAGEEDVHAAPAINDPTGGTAELEAELLHTPGPTGLPAHAAEGVLP